MIGDLFRGNVGPQAYRKLVQLFGEPEEVLAIRRDVQRAQDALHAAQTKHKQEQTQLSNKLEQVGQEKLEWMAKESAIRKELQDCQERSKDLLEQVVRLTHQKRSAAKDLLDQKFKTEATPLERTRFEMEQTEARGRVRRAEERARQLEEKYAHDQAKIAELTKKAKKLKQLESELAWVRKQSTAHLQALGATILRLRTLESQMAEHDKAIRAVQATKQPAKKEKAKSTSTSPKSSIESADSTPLRAAYRRPSIRKATKEMAAKFDSQPRQALQV